ncbi:MAG: ABC transporter substrate-binding protein [Candidatus Limivicinus sp.]|jgi:peptide/nickel transport system substrate-binding protein
MNIKRFLCLLTAAVMLFGCTACGSKSDEPNYDKIPESTGGKDVERSEAADEIFSLNCNPDFSFNPLVATNHSNQLVCCLVYENMIELDNDFSVIKNVIVDWDYSEDYTSWIFTIDPAHTFHDGSPVTCKDLRYSLERAINSDRYKGRFSSVLGVSYSDTEMYVTLGIGDSQFVKLLNIPIIKSGTFPDDYPLGSGPYMYNEDFTKLLPYEGYVGPPIEKEKSEDEEEEEEEETEDGEKAPLEHGVIEHPVDEIYLKSYGDAESIITAFEDSLIDVVINDPSSYTNLGYASTNEIHTYATTNMHYVVINEAGVLGKYSNFRYAMNFAFDRNSLVGLLHGNGVASPIAMYPTCADYPSDLADNLSYDLDMCKTVLENAGVKDYDNDGMLEYMSGTPQEIDLVFVVCSDSSAKTGMVRRFADDMASIGLKITVQELAWEDYLTALEEGNFDFYYGEVKLRNNFDLTELLQVRDVDEDDGNTSTNLNFSNTTDISYETYMNAYLSAPNMDRAFQYRTLAEFISQNAMLIPIGFEKQQIICHRGVVKGVNANYGNPLYDFVNWQFIEE